MLQYLLQMPVCLTSLVIFTLHSSSSWVSNGVSIFSIVELNHMRTVLPEAGISGRDK